MWTRSLRLGYADPFCCLHSCPPSNCRKYPVVIAATGEDPMKQSPTHTLVEWLARPVADDCMAFSYCNFEGLLMSATSLTPWKSAQKRRLRFLASPLLSLPFPHSLTIRKIMLVLWTLGRQRSRGRGGDWIGGVRDGGYLASQAGGRVCDAGRRRGGLEGDRDQDG